MNLLISALTVTALILSSFPILLYEALFTLKFVKDPNVKNIKLSFSLLLIRLFVLNTLTIILKLNRLKMVMKINAIKPYITVKIISKIHLNLEYNNTSVSQLKEIYSITSNTSTKLPLVKSPSAIWELYGNCRHPEVSQL